MASTPKQMNGKTTNNNGPPGKRKKSRGSKGSYLSKWLDKTMHHIQEPTPNTDIYDSFVNPNLNWPINNAQFVPGYDPCRFNLYGCTPEPMSLPTLPTYCNPAMMAPFYSPEYRYMQGVNQNIQVQRPKQRRRSENKAEEVHSTPNDTPNSTLSNHNYLQPKNFSDSQDFASLPPIVTSVADTNSNSDMNVNEKDDSCNARRFSDPCVRGLPDVARPANENVDSDSETSSSGSGGQVGSRLLSCLLDQITSLKMANERLNKDLQETKAELNNIQRQNHLWQKGPGTNIGANHNHSPLSSNGLLGGQYSPGFLTDLVREIRDAARLREEALYSRVRSMLHDRTENGLSSSEAKFTEKALDEIKSTLRSSEADKRRMMDRIVKLEEELRVLRVGNGIDSNENGVTNGNAEDVDTERLRLRKEIAEMRRSKQNAEEHALKRLTNIYKRSPSHIDTHNTRNAKPLKNTCYMQKKPGTVTGGTFLRQIQLRGSQVCYQHKFFKSIIPILKHHFPYRLERLVTQLRSKFNGVQVSPNGPESLSSEHEHEVSARARRTSVNTSNNTSNNASNNSTVVFGPVTDL